MSSSGSWGFQIFVTFIQVRRDAINYEIPEVETNANCCVLLHEHSNNSSQHLYERGRYQTMKSLINAHRKELRWSYIHTGENTLRNIPLSFSFFLTDLSLYFWWHFVLSQLAQNVQIVSLKTPVTTPNTWQGIFTIFRTSWFWKCAYEKAALNTPRGRTQNNNSGRRDPNLDHQPEQWALDSASLFLSISWLPLSQVHGRPSLNLFIASFLPNHPPPCASLLSKLNCPASTVPDGWLTWDVWVYVTYDQGMA